MNSFKDKIAKVKNSKLINRVNNSKPVVLFKKGVHKLDSTIGKAVVDPRESDKKKLQKYEKLMKFKSHINKSDKSKTKITKDKYNEYKNLVDRRKKIIDRAERRLRHKGIKKGSISKAGAVIGAGSAFVVPLPGTMEVGLIAGKTLGTKVDQGLIMNEARKDKRYKQVTKDLKNLHKDVKLGLKVMKQVLK